MPNYPPAPSAPELLNEHIETIVTFQAQAERNLDTHQRFIERATAHVGRPRSIYMLLGMVVIAGTSNAVPCRIPAGIVRPVVMSLQCTRSLDDSAP